VRLATTFSVAKSGEQVMGSATPEATLEPTVPPPTSVPTGIITSLTPIPTSGYNPRILTIVSGSLIIIGLGILLAF